MTVDVKVEQPVINIEVMSAEIRFIGDHHSTDDQKTLPITLMVIACSGV